MYLAVDLQGGVERAWSNVATFVPKLAAALVVVVVGHLVAGTGLGPALDPRGPTGL